MEMVVKTSPKELRSRVVMVKTIFLMVLMGVLVSCAPRFEPIDTEIPAAPPHLHIPEETSLIPYDTGWEYGQILNRRPGNGIVPRVNPPRFSWPYLDTVVAEDLENVPPTLFTLEVSRAEDFEAPIIRVTDTPYNFYNALKPLEEGDWYWRVGYGAGPDVQWSDVYQFRIQASTPSWDRSSISTAVELLVESPRSRLGPRTGTWRDFYQRMSEAPELENRFQRMFTECDRIMGLDWWNNFPETDHLGRPPKNREEKTRFILILKELTIVAYAYRLTGDEAYAGSIPRIVEMASWPQGGLLSPEGALGGHTKMPSQAVELFAYVYDWFSEDLSPENKEVLQEAIRWRLEDMYFHPDSIIWQQGNETMRHYGLAYGAGSHPYQNFAWSVPAILLMAGELEIADSLTPLALHYLCGVTLPEGPEEGYNEGHGYSNEKAGTLLEAVIVTDLLLPELTMGKNPALQNLVDWFAFMFSGPEKLPWGDSWLKTARNVGGRNLRKLAVLTESPLAASLWQQRADGDYSENIRGMYSRPWIDFAVWDHHRDSLNELQRQEPEIGSTLFLKHAGWVFDHSRPILTLDDYRNAVGLQMQMRPMGGYGHSYPSDGSFTWFGFGEQLSMGGGWRSWASLGYSRDALSHNSILVNGLGHDPVDVYQPQRPITSRPVAFDQKAGYTYWVAELSPGFPEDAGVYKWNRHVLRIRDVYFLYDDLEAHEPSIFTWLFHIHQEVPVTLDTSTLRYAVHGVQAEVHLATPAEIAMTNAVAREGYRNPVTGEDHYPEDIERASSRGIFKSYVDAPLQHNNIHASNTEPQKTFSFLAVLACGKEESQLPVVQVKGPKQVVLTFPDQESVSVSFDTNHQADITVDPTLHGLFP